MIGAVASGFRVLHSNINLLRKHELRSCSFHSLKVFIITQEILYGKYSYLSIYLDNQRHCITKKNNKKSKLKYTRSHRESKIRNIIVSYRLKKALKSRSTGLQFLLSSLLNIALN